MTTFHYLLLFTGVLLMLIGQVLLIAVRHPPNNKIPEHKGFFMLFAGLNILFPVAFPPFATLFTTRSGFAILAMAAGLLLGCVIKRSNEHLRLETRHPVLSFNLRCWSVLCVYFTLGMATLTILMMLYQLFSNPLVFAFNLDRADLSLLAISAGLITLCFYLILSSGKSDQNPHG